MVPQSFSPLLQKHFTLPDFVINAQYLQACDSVVTQSTAWLVLGLLSDLQRQGGMQDSIPGLKVLLSWSLDLPCLVSFLLWSSHC